MSISVNMSNKNNSIVKFPTRHLGGVENEIFVDPPKVIALFIAKVFFFFKF